MSINKECSNLQEHELAKFLDGNVVSGSGCGKFYAGDVELPAFLIECKTVTKPQTQFSVKRDWMNKIEEQRYECGKDFGALAFRFEPQGSDYIVLRDEDFKTLLSLIPPESFTN